MTHKCVIRPQWVTVLRWIFMMGIPIQLRRHHFEIRPNLWLPLCLVSNPDEYGYINHISLPRKAKESFQEGITCFQNVIKITKIANIDSYEMDVLLFYNFIWYTWWRHQMETFSALLALCAGDSPVTGEFPAQRLVTWSFDVFSDIRLNKRLSKQSWGWWLEMPSSSLWHHCNDIFISLTLFSPLAGEWLQSADFTRLYLWVYFYHP